MKPTHLEVTPEGIFVIENCPEEPELCVMLDKNLKQDVSLGHISCDILGCQCDVKQEDYHKALASCKRIRVANHNDAFFRIQDQYMPKGAKEFKLTTGIYKIDCEWEVESKCELWCSDCKASDWSTCRERQVAILKESQQEALLRTLRDKSDQLDNEDRARRNPTAEQMSIKAGPSPKESQEEQRFTIEDMKDAFTAGANWQVGHTDKIRNGWPNYRPTFGEWILTRNK